MGQNTPIFSLTGEQIGAGISPDQTKGVFEEALDVTFHQGYAKLLQSPSLLFQTPQRVVKGILNQPDVLTYGFSGGIGRWMGGVNPDLQFVDGTDWKFLAYGTQTIGVNSLGKLWHFSDGTEEVAVPLWREVTMPDPLRNIAIHKNFLMGVNEDYVAWANPDSLTTWHDHDMATFADRRPIRDIGTNVGGIIASGDYVYVADGERLWYITFDPGQNSFNGPTLVANGIGTESKWGMATAQGQLLGFGRMGAWSFDGETHRLLMNAQIQETVLGKLNYERLDEVCLFHHADIEIMWFGIPVGDGFETYGFNYINNSWTQASFTFTACDNSEIGVRRFFATPNEEIAVFTRNQGTGINVLNLTFPTTEKITLGWGYGQWGNIPWGG